MILNLRRPICVNHGCSNLVDHGRKDKYGNKRWRSLCKICLEAGQRKRPYPLGVVPFKKGICSNVDGHLGFVCVINWTLVSQLGEMHGLTELDHKDGNVYNNDPSNIDELCPICHRKKGQLNRDYDRYKKKKTEVMLKNKQRASEIFE